MALPVGKLPHELLARLISTAPIQDKRVILGPGIGLDCAVLDIGDSLLVFKSDPITFATDEIGWYAVHINANDIATSGGVPRWFLVTILLPEKTSTQVLVEEIFRQITQTCQELGVSLIGGHTEITHGLDRPILVGTMIGEVGHAELITPCGARSDDRILLTKGVPIEATAILAREFPDKLKFTLTPEEIDRASRFLYDPGISVLRDARIAIQSGEVTAMHDPTEGGLAAALWELADASGKSLAIDIEAVPIPGLSALVCQALSLDPLEVIASGSLLFTSPASDVRRICQAMKSEGLLCSEIGVVEDGPLSVWGITKTGRKLISRPARDGIARMYTD